jgi:mono/diheme cytochrome c family protein
VVLLLAVPGWVEAQNPETYFRQNCASCHTIGGGVLTGPDLKDVESRKDREWLLNFIQNPQRVIDSGDPYAQSLVRAARGVIMPPPPGISRELATSLLDLVRVESGKETSQFVGPKLAGRPLTPQDIADGQALFLGDTVLRNGGTACVSCHSVNGDTSLLGGGTLAPNLTDVFSRLGGQQSLAAWLSAPATPTMQAIFRDTPLAPEEILPLVAYLKQQAETQPPPRSAPPVNFLLMGLGGAAILLAGFDLVWRRRFHAVRRPLVDRIRHKVYAGAAARTQGDQA